MVKKVTHFCPCGFSHPIMTEDFIYVVRKTVLKQDP